jgi:hypothetical protein
VAALDAVIQAGFPWKALSSSAMSNFTIFIIA